ncbi:TetR/AcrR family transcriptional regulator [soil metagenome]
MGRCKQFDEATVVRAARDLFWERGFASTSLADVESATGLSRSSLYQAFNSKQGLYARAIQSYCDEIMWPLVEPMEAQEAGRHEVVAYFLALAHRLHGPHSVASRGCLVANTASELTVLDPRASAVVRDFRERVHLALLHAVSAIAGIRDCDGKAEILTAAQFGLMTAARFDPSRAAAMAEAIAADVQTW